MPATEADRPDCRTLVLGLGLSLVAVGFLYHRVLGQWWTADDPMLLWHAAEFRPVSYFFDPSVWRSFNPASLNPWLVLAYDLDLAVFGLHPMGFYLHQLAALIAACFAFWSCLRLYLSPLASTAGMLVLAVAPASAEIAGNLATRHYVDGLALSCLVFLVFVRSLRRADIRLSLAAAGCFVLVLTTKEIFAPLPVVLALLPEGRARRRLGYLLPFAVVLACYGVWRGVMLGTIVGGYRVRLIPTGPETLSALASLSPGSGWQSVVPATGLLVVMIGGLVVLARCRPPWRWFWLGFAGCAVVPVLPVLHVYSPRHSYAVAVLVAAATGSVVDRLVGARIGTGGRLVVGAGGLVVASAAVAGAWAGLPEQAQVRRVGAEGREVLRGRGPEHVVVAPLMPYWHFYGLVQLRETVLGLPAGPGVAADTCVAMTLSRDESTERPIELGYDPSVGRLVAMARTVEPCRIVTDDNLRVEIRYDPAANLTVWRLGSDTEGVYSVLWAITPNSLVGVEVPPTGERRGNLAFEMGVDLVVEHRAAGGERALTPRLTAVRRGNVVEVLYPEPR